MSKRTRRALLAFAIVWFAAAFSPRLLDNGLGGFTGDERQAAEYVLQAFSGSDNPLWNMSVQKLRVEGVKTLTPTVGDHPRYQARWEVSYRVLTYFGVTHSVWAIRVMPTQQGQLDAVWGEPVDGPPGFDWFGRFWLTAFVPWAFFGLLLIVWRRRYGSSR